MARGRKPKDPKVIELQASSHRADPAPAPAAGVPGAIEPPDWFTEDQRFAWTFWTEQLALCGRLHMMDSLALVAAASAYGNAVASQRMVNEDPTNWRAGVAASRFWTQVRAFCTEFGLTLISRNKVLPTAGPTQLDLELEHIITQAS